MTREGEIFFQSKKYALELFYDDTSIDYEDCAFHFRMGARFADSLPKSPWISVKEDLPCKHEELISSEDKRNTFYVIALVHSFVVLSRMEKFEDEWHWTTDEPSHWFAIPELPKE